MFFTAAPSGLNTCGKSTFFGASNNPRAPYYRYMDPWRCGLVIFKSICELAATFLFTNHCSLSGGHPQTQGEVLLFAYGHVWRPDPDTRQQSNSEQRLLLSGFRIKGYGRQVLLAKETDDVDIECPLHEGLPMPEYDTREKVGGQHNMCQHFHPHKSNGYRRNYLAPARAQLFKLQTMKTVRMVKNTRMLKGRPR